MRADRSATELRRNIKTLAGAARWKWTAFPELGSNQRPVGPEPTALPLSYRGTRNFVRIAPKASSRVENLLDLLQLQLLAAERAQLAQEVSEIGVLN